MPIASPGPDAPPSAGFDSHGRLVPLEGEIVYSQVDRRYFSLAQPSFDFPLIHAAVEKHLMPSGLGSRLSAADFEHRCMATKAALLAAPDTAALFSGVHVPFLLPAHAGGDIAGELQTILLPAAGKAYVEKMPGFTFTNHAGGHLAGGLRPVAGARYERLLERHGREPMAGWYFPAALSGFAIPEQRRVIARLSESLSLAGPLEVTAAFIGVPDILMKADNYPNLLALSAVESADPKFFHFFEAYGWNLTYNVRSMIGAVSEYFAGGLVALA